MKTYEIRFTGRKVGAIGIFYPITAQVFADDAQAALMALYGRFEHITGAELKEIQSPFDGNGLVERVQNTQDEHRLIRLYVERLRDTIDAVAKRQTRDNQQWHDDQDAPDHGLWQSPSDQQFPRAERDKAILELVSRHLEVLNENEAAKEVA